MNLNDILAKAKAVNTRVDEVNKQNAQARAEKEYLTKQIAQMVEDLAKEHPELPKLDVNAPTFAQDLTDMLSASLTSVDKQTKHLEAVLEAEASGDRTTLETLLGIKLEVEEITMPELKQINEDMVAVPLATTPVEAEAQEVPGAPEAPGAPKQPTTLNVETVEEFATEDMYFELESTGEIILVKTGESLYDVYEGPENFAPSTKEQYDAAQEQKETSNVLAQAVEATQAATQAANKGYADPFASVNITVDLDEETTEVEKEPAKADYNAMFSNLVAEEAQEPQPLVTSEPVKVDISSALANQQKPVADNTDTKAMDDITKTIDAVTNIVF